ncbi:MAG: tetratricopeptide repeat protein [Treponema sp.]
MIVRNGDVTRKKNYLILKLTISFILIASFAVGGFFLYGFITAHVEKSPTIGALKKAWSVYDYNAAYDISTKILSLHPLNNAALTYRGYSSFYIAVSQLETADAQNYLDEAINSLRLAFQGARRSLIPQIEYMLGKAYFYKNTVSSYYYADLAAKYLGSAAVHGYKADDIPEYLGLSYAALGMPMESISAFTEALLVRESYTLLLSIAEQYYKAGQATAAKQYLFRIKNETDDQSLALKSMNLLGTIYTEEGNFDEAEKEFENILQKNKNSADAYYGLGVIYEKQGNLVKARSLWRKALKIQVNHPGALAKFSDYK